MPVETSTGDLKRDIEICLGQIAEKHQEGVDLIACVGSAEATLRRCLNLSEMPRRVTDLLTENDRLKVAHTDATEMLSARFDDLFLFFDAQVDAIEATCKMFDPKRASPIAKRVEAKTAALKVKIEKLEAKVAEMKPGKGARATIESVGPSAAEQLEAYKTQITPLITELIALRAERDARIAEGKTP